MTKRCILLLALVVVLPVFASVAGQRAGLRIEVAQGFAALALNCVQREYPNKITHVLFSAADVAPPDVLTPAFYGCFDWHSAVHAHWLLARLLRVYPRADFAAAARSVLNSSLTVEHIAREVRYIDPRSGFERPYGLAWLLQLDSELQEWKDPDAQRWHANLQPLVQVAVAHLASWLPKLAQPIRVGEHAQTAFALGLVRDWAVVAKNLKMQALVDERARHYYAGDTGCPLRFEPSGHDFLSPCLAEADLMRRVMSGSEFQIWLTGFLPEIPDDGRFDWLPVAQVSDPTDGKLVHLDGLNLSRAWMLQGIAQALDNSDARRIALLAAAQQHTLRGIADVSGAHYQGGHWLASFATYLLTQRGLRHSFSSVLEQEGISHVKKQAVPGHFSQRQ